MIAQGTFADGRGHEAEGPEARAWEIERRIERKVWGRIYGLRVDCTGDDIVLRGHCRSYYTKQLAQEAALDLAGSPARLDNQIVVG